jgi:hypothetical protein
MEVDPHRITRIKEDLARAFTSDYQRSISLEAFSDRYVVLADALAIYLQIGRASCRERV